MRKRQDHGRAARARRKAEAEARQALRDQRTPRQQIALLVERPGASVWETTRMTGLIEGEA